MPRIEPEAGWEGSLRLIANLVTPNVAARTSYSYILKHIPNLLEDPRRPSFRIRGGQIWVTAGKE